MSRAGRVFQIFNILVGALYGLAAALILRRLLVYDLDLLGGSVAAGTLLALAIGHMLVRRWAIMSSAAVLGAVSLLSIVYLFPPYEEALLPPFESRILRASLLWVATALAVGNYLFHRHLRDRESANGEKRA